LNDWQVTWEKRITRIFHKGEKLVGVFVVEIIKENSANAPTFLSMFDVKVLIAPFFEVWIVSFIMTVACILQSLVEMNCIFVI